MPDPFKNKIDAAVAKQLGQAVQAVYPKFPYKAYLDACVKQLPSLELKQRAHAIGEALRQALPANTPQAMRTLLKAIRSLPLENETGEGWAMFPINALLESHGLEAFEESMKLIPEVTKRFTAEFAIRTFIINEPKKTTPYLKRWAKSSNVHLRRLVSEGTRPRLPWAEQIQAYKANPKPIFPFLEQLKDDPEEYVRRSVANNLNDISKDHPEQMLNVVEKWIKDRSKQRAKLVKHACRTLIKQGDKRCLALLGYSPPKLKSAKLSLSAKSILLGNKIVVTTSIHSSMQSDQNLILDYRFHFVKSNGATTPKVFKGSIVTLPANAKKEIERSFHLRSVTTRRYYTGNTRIELFVNGHTVAEATFTLNIPE